MSAAIQEKEAVLREDAGRLADFIVFTQRGFLLNLSAELNEGGVSFPQFFLLGFLATGERLTMSQVAKKMSHSTAAATGLVDRLEKLGYAERGHASGDRRKVVVTITPRGVELVNRLREGIVRHLIEAMAESGGEANALTRQIAQLLPGGAAGN